MLQDSDEFWADEHETFVDVAVQDTNESAQHIAQQTNGGYEDSAQINRLIKMGILNDNGHPTGCGCECCGGAG